MDKKKKTGETLYSAVYALYFLLKVAPSPVVSLQLMRCHRKAVDEHSSVQKRGIDSCSGKIELSHVIQSE